jgi:hypothetical protein
MVFHSPEVPRFILTGGSTWLNAIGGRAGRFEEEVLPLAKPHWIPGKIRSRSQNIAR